MIFSDLVPEIKDKVAWHNAPYPAIDPTRPELSQNGKTILVTGSSSGIGLYIARSFAKADAATVILTGRDPERLSKTVDELKEKYPKTNFIGKKLDMADLECIITLWDELHAQELVVDVLVRNASSIQYHDATMLQLGREGVMTDFLVNIGSNMQLIDGFYNQKKRDPKKKLFLVNVSTLAIHNFEVTKAKANYSVSKNAETLMIQQIANSVPPSDMQIVSFHPGALLTDASRKAGNDKSDIPWDDDDLPGYYAVWAASKEAEFLHGRFTWSAWDVNDVLSGPVRERINSDPNYLKIGVIGL